MSRLGHTPVAALATRLQAVDWPCRDPRTGSLYPIAPTDSRRCLFCTHCTAHTCLFGGTPSTRRLGQPQLHWAMPDGEGLTLYLDALRVYTALLREGRTCWCCRELRCLSLKNDRYVCALPENLPWQGEILDYAMSRTQARLRTAIEGCGNKGFAPRAGDVPRLALIGRRYLHLADGQKGRCASCQHLRGLLVGNKERFYCVLEAGGVPPEENNWCAGQLWRAGSGEHPAAHTCQRESLPAACS